MTLAAGSKLGPCDNSRLPVVVLNWPAELKK